MLSAETLPRETIFIRTVRCEQVVDSDQMSQNDVYQHGVTVCYTSCSILDVSTGSEMDVFKC